MERGGQHIVAGLVAAVALPIAVFGLGLPLLIALPAAAVLYAGTALAVTPRRRIERIDFSAVDRTQLEVARELIGESDGVLHRLRAAARELRAPGDRQTVAALGDAAQAILERLAAEPDKLTAVRRFLSYYLPATAEIAEGLVTVERQVVPDSRRRASIEATLSRLKDAFAFYADNLDRADLDSLDIELKLVDRALAEDIASQRRQVAQGE